MSFGMAPPMPKNNCWRGWGRLARNSKLTDGIVSATTQHIKPTETVVKQETIDPSDIHAEENDDKSYMFQQRFSEEEAGPSATTNEEEPPPKERDGLLPLKPR
ncbi:hypothetical protein NQ318_020912 [Aromia moschata]|uniref:Uncharacterized protein n=1 Tax=Aromia moschata TaxID=1265417 RepID=A0AAV8XZY4_9CUCU|nr:hypothetical protein NQ318_020912 [Aromia moschata]